MKRFIGWLLFETRLGDCLLHVAERHFGLGVLPIEAVDEATSVLLCGIRA